MSNIGVITEQNDLGLGFDPLNEKDQKTYQESVQKQSIVGDDCNENLLRNQK